MPDRAAHGQGQRIGVFVELGLGRELVGGELLRPMSIRVLAAFSLHEQRFGARETPDRQTDNGDKKHTGDDGARIEAHATPLGSVAARSSADGGAVDGGTSVIVL